jgi:tetratricopeptide (TPR) repeat protein
MKKPAKRKRPSHKLTQKGARSSRVVDGAVILQNLETALELLDFDAVLSQITTLDWDTLDSTTDMVTLLGIKCAAAEVLDYFGRYQDALAIILPHGQECEHLLNAMADGRKEPPIDGDGRRLLKQQVWVGIHWAYTFYRSNNNTRALSILRDCRATISRHVSDDNNPCLFTHSRICYGIGLVYRQNYRYSEAKDEFTAAMAFASRALVARGPTSTSQRPHFITAKCLALGLGWICYNEGRLELAEPLLITARTLLTATPERLINAYVDVVHACIQRAAHGDTVASLSETVAILVRSYTVFERDKHDAYKVRAANELALAQIQLAVAYDDNSPLREEALEKATRYAREVEAFATREDNARWHCNALIIWSRIHRHVGRTAEARQAAQSALDKAAGDRFSGIDAWIALGEAHLRLKEYSDAIRCFTEALEAGGDNPKVRAVCYLHMANTYLLDNKVRDAKKYFNNWLIVKGLVVNAFVRSLGQKVESKIREGAQDFFLPFSDPSLDVDICEKLFHGWFVRWAREHSSGDGKDATAEKLRKTVGCVTNWIKEEAKAQALLASQK